MDKCFHCKTPIKKKAPCSYVPYRKNGKFKKRYWCQSVKCQAAIDKEYPQDSD